MDVSIHRTYCKFCVAKCGVLVEIDQSGQVEKVRGDPDHPLSQGYLCPKGRAIGRLHHHPDRLNHPGLGRDSERSYPGWDAVLGDLATRLSKILGSSGPGAVAAYGGNGGAQDNVGFALLSRLTRSLGSRNWYTALTIDSPAKGLIAELMAGYSGLTIHSDDECTMNIIVGANPAVSHGHTSARSSPLVWLRNLARSGEVWVLDPRRSETARAATRHLAVRPGSDYAVLAFLIRDLLTEGADAEFLGLHAEGVSELRQAVEPFNRSTAADLAGVPECSLTDLLQAVRSHGRLSVLTGTGATMAPTANLTEWMAWALLVVTGSMERSRGMWFNPGPGDSYRTRTFPAKVRDAQPGPPSRPELPRRWGQFPCAGLVDEIESGNVRALMVIGGNPLASFPEPQRVRAALASLEVLVVLDIVRNGMTDMATHVLPCAGDLERAEVASGAVSVIPAIFAQYSKAVLPVGADRRPAWKILLELSNRLGMDPLIPEEAATSDEGVIASLVGYPLDDPPIPFGVVHDYRPTMGWVAERVLPGGRWQLAPEALVHQLRATEGLVQYGDCLKLVPRRQLRHMNSALTDGGGPGALSDTPDLQMHPSDAAAAGVAAGDRVSISSSYGSVEATVTVDPLIRKGVVSLPHGFVAVNVNALTSSHDGVDPLTGMVSLSGVPVRVVSIA